MNIHFLVLARDSNFVNAKCEELDNMKLSYTIICGEEFNHKNIIYREPKGKYDAINYGYKTIPKNTDIVALNDVDTKIYNINHAINVFQKYNVALLFSKVRVGSGPQKLFYKILDSLRRILLIAASGELMLIRHDFLKKIMPLKSCKSEDSYILFKVLELGGKVIFCEDTFVLTNRTSMTKEEEAYKRRTVGGIYQALSMSKPPFKVKLFYTILPLISPLLLVLGKKGYYWFRGIVKGYVDYLRGDRSGSWKSNYSVIGVSK